MSDLQRHRRVVREPTPARSRTARPVRRPPARPLSANALLELMRLASPSLPVGGFSYSEGLEAAVDAALVTNEAEAQRWLLDQLHLALGRADLPIVARALAAWRRLDEDRIVELNAWFQATRESSEPRLQTEQTGRSLAQWLKLRGAADPRLRHLESLKPAPTWPIAFALAAADTDASPRDVLVAFAAGWAENMTQAAIRSVPLGQSAAQRILSALAAEIPAVVAAALGIGMAEMQAFTPMLAIVSAQHEEQYSRLFRS
jgi:urease accessory protein